MARDTIGLWNVRLPREITGVNRRAFLHTTASALALIPLNRITAASSPGVRWPIGCFNRPWVNDRKGWTQDTALDGIKAAGYTLTGLLSRTAKEPFIGADATPEYLAALKQKIAARGLKVNMGALRMNNNAPLTEQIKTVRQQIDNGRTVGVEFLLTFGVDKAEHYENYYKLMQNLVRRRQHHLLHRQGPGGTIQAHRATRHRLLREGLRQGTRCRDDSVRRRQGGFRRRVRRIEARRFQWPRDGRVLCAWGNARSRDRQRAPEPRVSGKGVCRALKLFLSIAPGCSVTQNTRESSPRQASCLTDGFG
jgi:hypothetical protein